MDVLIDRVPMEEYGARLLSFTASACPVTTALAPARDYDFPRLLRSELGAKTLTIRADICGADRPEAAMRFSRLFRALCGETELFLPDGYFYRCVYQSASAPSWVTPQTAQVEFTFTAVRHGPLETIDVPHSNFPIRYQGTAPAGYRIRFTPQSAQASITVCGITVRNVAAGAPVEIDGINKRVTQNSANKFADTDLIHFPRFQAADELLHVTVSPDMPVQIRYYPTFL